MRYIFYTFVFSLSCFFLSSCCAPEPKLVLSCKEQACYLRDEFCYKEFGLADLESICHAALTLQNAPKEKKVAEFHFPKIEGVFFKNPLDQSVLFIPDDKKKSYLGRGHHKKVYRGLWFLKEKAEVVAACIGDKSIVQEADVFKLVSLGNSHFSYRTSFPLSASKFVLVLRMYNMGGLNKLDKFSYSLSFQQKIMLALDIASALECMHLKGVAHRDLHEGNILIHRSSTGVLSAGLIDFGRAKSLYAKVKDRPQGANSKNPPEVLFISYRDIKKVSADTYALGCLFYKLFFQKDYSAVGLIDYRTLSKLTPEEKEEILLKIKSMYEAALIEYQMECETCTNSSPYIVLKGKILEMLNPDPEKRCSVSDMVVVLKECLAKTSAAL